MEDFRNTGDILGKIKNLRQQDINRPSNLEFGMPSGVARKGGRPRLSAAEVMKGNYTEDDALPDRDLGRSITPGFRNTDHEVCHTFKNEYNEMLKLSTDETSFSILLRIKQPTSK